MLAVPPKHLLQSTQHTGGRARSEVPSQGCHQQPSPLFAQGTCICSGNFGAAELDGVAEVVDSAGDKVLLVVSCKRQERAQDVRNSFMRHVNIVCSSQVCKTNVPQPVRVRHRRCGALVLQPCDE